jgi:ABC-type multidrug transport system fused ATPase/permease subunit
MNKDQNIHLLSLKPNRYALLTYLTVGLLRSVVTFLLSVSIGEFYQLCFQAGGARARLLEKAGVHLESIESFFVFFGILILIKMAGDFAENYLMNKAAENFVQNLRESVFQTQLSWSSEQFGRRHFGKYLLRYSNDMKAVQNYISRGIYGGWRDALFLFVGIAILYLLNVELATIYLLLMIVSVVLIIYISRKQIPIIENSRNKRNQLLAFVTKSFQRHTRIKTSQIESKVIGRYEKYSQQLKQMNLRNHRFDSTLLALFTFLQYGIIVFLLYRIYHIHQLFPGKQDIGTALVFLLIVLQINPTLKRIMKVPSILNKGKVSLRKIQRIRPTATEGTD